MQKKWQHIFDRLIDSMAVAAAVILLAVVFAVAISVTLRYLHLRSPIWVLQYTEYALLWITFLGAAWLLRHDGHISIDSVISRVPGKYRDTVQVINDLLGCLVCLLVFIFGALHTIDLFQRNILDVKGTNVPKYLIYWVVPFGGLTLAIQFLRRVVKDLRDLMSGGKE